jgi:carbamoyltransferase
MTLVLGISYGYHDSAVSLVKDGELIAAAHEERFSRIKFDSRFPRLALKWLVNQYDLGDKEIHFAYYEDPALKKKRQLWNIKVSLPHVKLIKKLPETIMLSRGGIEAEITSELEFLKMKKPLSFSFVEHHESHVSASFYASGFTEAAGIVADAVGEWDTTSLWSCSQKNLRKIESQIFPDSLGLLYSMVTYFCGFKVNSGEYKLMGLAPYGNPRFVNEIQQICKLTEAGFPKLDRKYLGFLEGESIINSRMEELFGFPERKASPLTQKHADLAASIQVFLEDSLLKLTKHLFEIQDSRNLVFSGGVALNCVANNRLLMLNKDIKDMFIFPAAGDAGGSAGAAFRAYANLSATNQENKPKKIQDVYLGRSYTDFEILEYLRSLGIESSSLLINQVAQKLNSGATVGWFQGRSEFGPRALGNRSILADPRIDKGQIYINEKIKFRESFRPFAPIVTERQFKSLFQDEVMTDYMLRTTSVRDYSYSQAAKTDTDEPISIENRLIGLRSKIPSVTHLDGSARVQKLTEAQNPLMYSLLTEFGKLAGVECLINTSFNVRGEPIVDSLEDALRCFATTGLDFLVLGNRVVEKSSQNLLALSLFSSAVGDD